MGSQVPPTTAPAAAISIASGDAGSFDDRWAAWQAKGVAHERAFHRKVMIALPILIVVTAVVTYVLLGL